MNRYFIFKSELKNEDFEEIKEECNEIFGEEEFELTKGKLVIEDTEENFEKTKKISEEFRWNYNEDELQREMNQVYKAWFSESDKKWKSEQDLECDLMTEEEWTDAKDEYMNKQILEIIPQCYSYYFSGWNEKIYNVDSHLIQDFYDEAFSHGYEKREVSSYLYEDYKKEWQEKKMEEYKEEVISFYVRTIKQYYKDLCDEGFSVEEEEKEWFVHQIQQRMTNIHNTLKPNFQINDCNYYDLHTDAYVEAWKHEEVKFLKIN